MRIYISGPVSGMPAKRLELFERAARQLEAAGYKVSVPTRMVDAGTKYHKAMRLCFAELLRCQGVAMLPGWRRSKGASTEVRVAVLCGMEAKSVEAWLEGGRR